MTRIDFADCQSMIDATTRPTLSTTRPTLSTFIRLKFLVRSCLASEYADSGDEDGHAIQPRA